MLVEAYLPVAHGAVLKSAALAEMAGRYGVSVAQLCIRYCLQLGPLPLPKTTSVDHLRANLSVDFGDVADEGDAVTIMDAALEAGINYFDTADVYDGPQKPDMKKGYGKSEEIVGRWVTRTGKRDRIVLATKFY